MITILSVIGTRPEAIKMAPVVKELDRHPDHIQSVVCATGQHREMLESIWELFDVRPAVDLAVMQPNQTLSGLTARLLEKLEVVIEEHQPDWVLAQGDTTTVLAAALTAFYKGIRFGHVEAGLRTNNLWHPFPEEFNRRTADSVTDLFFAPTQLSKETLLREGQADENIVVTGNTVIDALHYVTQLPYDWSAGPLGSLPDDRRLVLITAHRRESFGESFRELCLAIRDLAERFSDKGVHFVYPVHPNPNVRQPVEEILSGVENISLLEPLDYVSFANLMKRSSLVLTDSGGVQEEAPGLSKPVLVMRKTTERPEGVQAGVVRLVGTSRSRIVAETAALLDSETAYMEMARTANPYGDGHAAERIVKTLLERSP